MDQKGEQIADCPQPLPQRGGCPSWRFTTRAVLYAVALFAAGLGAFGMMRGMICTMFVMGFWSLAFRSLHPLRALWNGIVALLAMALFAWIFVLPILDELHVRPLNRCLNSIREVGLGILTYEIDQGRFPPAFLADKDGPPMHSWRVLILPYLGEDELYRKYKFDEPWDGPNNIKLLNQMPAVYRCPQRGDQRRGITHYSAVVGPETMWPGARGVTMNEVTDGAGKTILVVEHPEGMPWTKPTDLQMDEYLDMVADGSALASHKFERDFTYVLTKISWVAMADVHTEHFTGVLDLGITRAMLTRAGGESYDEVDWRRRSSLGIVHRVVHTRWDKVVSWGAFFILSVLPTFPLLRTASRKGRTSSDARGIVKYR